MEPCLLALDTSTETMALALQTPAGLRLHEEAGGAAASARLVPAAMQLLADAGMTLAQLDAIAFGAGPGAFTGLRTACAVAQGLAFGAGKPVLAVDSLLVVVDDAYAQQPAQAAPPPIDGQVHWAAVDARMDEVYAAAYRRDARGWSVVHRPALYTLPALIAAWADAPPQHIAGNALTAFADRLAPVAAGAICVPLMQSRAAALARLAEAAWRRGEAIDAADALPLYLRDKVALTTAERTAHKAVPEGRR
ncbi:tRNA (adenosine(37)-N6)-threonylcarbamoyltransferase complex dimerization subunit type 1 TsaB [Aquabacterium humicola]|uniref:tRNA (adenosine(37)-N6)-threonylcarbamoyltransferase complex dimerization subunit type 1 TsaB n=1 Tax=Aquabacterium humicola TaxID=3237377 RepID=UPI002542B01D|nr:tRNA (adenosine(37)-N6)-threonylcarbamoyltransferase complex dimerization subunit type 1 TsaB [Rubrivivax pictus]